MRRTWWEYGISAAVLLLVSLSINCTLDVSGLPGMEERPDQENAYTCRCECKLQVQNPTPDTDYTRSLNVCAPFELNPNVNPARNKTPLQDFEVIADCQNRVSKIYAAMASVCETGGIEVDCDCNAVLPTSFAEACNQTCDERPLDSTCSNFDPAGLDPANAATLPLIPDPGDEPVCLVPSGSSSGQSALVTALALPTAAPTPLAAGIFGQRTTCVLDPAVSLATVTLGDEAPQNQPTVSGVVEFQGTPCPGASCAVDMTYQLDLAPFSFSGFCAGTEITDVRAVGAVGSQAIVLNANGEAEIAPGQTLTSARGTRIDSGLCITDQELQASFVGTNVDAVAVAVDWAGKTCTVNGTLLGTTDEDINQGRKTLSVAVHLQGTLQNQPPTARAGADQTVECTSAAGAEITLNGADSSDPDNNISVIQWQQGSRIGPLVGDVLQVTLPQGVGTTGQYILRVIDAAAQADEDTTTVQVADTLAPTIASVQATPPVLKPPNHQMVPVTVAVEATDSCDAAPVCQLTAISSNELVNGTGDGNTSPDWEVTGPLTVNLRAERAGSGNGRVYTLTVECTDATGNAAQGTTTVTVPKGTK